MAAALWVFLFNPTVGIVAWLLRAGGVSWNHLLDGDQAMLLVVLAAAWKQISYNFLFFLAGLAGIPEQLADAARVDGAGPLRLFWSITLPLLRPTTSFVLITRVISSFQVFDTVYAMTGGGPGGATQVVAYRIYSEAFTSLRMGRAAAISVALLVVLVAVTVAQRWWFSRRSTYELSA